MTCVVGMLGEDGKVWMGADSYGGDYHTYEKRKDKKIFINGDYLIGFTTSFRMGQLLMFGDLPPVGKKKDLFKFMVTEFIPAIRELLKEGGYSKISENQESGGEFLVGVKGHIFRIDNDFQVQESIGDVVTCGAGESFALSSMKTMNSLDTDMNCKEKIKLSLNISSQISAHVRPPFHIMKI